MMLPPSGVRVWLAAGATDMRRGMNGLALQVQQALQRDPHAGDVYVFRGKRGNLVKILWHDGLGMSLYAKRLERRDRCTVSIRPGCKKRALTPSARAAIEAGVAKGPSSRHRACGDVWRLWTPSGSRNAAPGRSAVAKSAPLGVRYGSALSVRSAEINETCLLSP